MTTAQVVPLNPHGKTPELPNGSTTVPLLRHVIGNVLRKERLRQRRTLDDVAADAGISTQYSSRWNVAVRNHPPKY